MATTYEFEEDALSGRWRWTQEVEGNFTEGRWYTKGAASLEVDEDTATVEIKIFGDDDNLTIPLNYITVPSGANAEDIFNALRTIIF